MIEKSGSIKNHFLSAASGLLAGGCGVGIGIGAAGGLFISPAITLTATFAGLAAMAASLSLNMSGKFDVKPATMVLALVAGFAPGMITAQSMVRDAVRQTFVEGHENARKYQSESDFCRSPVFHDGWKVLCK